MFCQLAVPNVQHRLFGVALPHNCFSRLLRCTSTFWYCADETDSLARPARSPCQETGGEPRRAFDNLRSSGANITTLSEPMKSLSFRRSSPLILPSSPAETNSAPASKGRTCDQSRLIYVHWTARIQSIRDPWRYDGSSLKQAQRAPPSNSSFLGHCVR